jgi:hypothetical protein
MEEEATGFLDAYAGNGLETIGAEQQAVPYLTMVQPDSAATADGATAGNWRNSATGEEYGSVVDVVVLAFHVIWNERNSEAPFNTVARYEPHAIEVTLQAPKGGRGYPKMINPTSGNEIQEMYVYAIILPDHPEAGVMYLNPSLNSMKLCRSWNTQLTSQLLKNGGRAPIFGYRWSLALELADNPKKKGAKMTRIAKVQKSTLISEDLFKTNIQPQIASVQKAVFTLTDSREDVANDGGAEE